MSAQAVTPRYVRFGIFEADLQTKELRGNGFKLRVQEQPLEFGLSVSSDGRSAYYCQHEECAADLMLVENFR